jgi:hypothetical protein
LTAVDYTPSDDFGKTIQQLDEWHNGPARLRKSIEDLEGQVDALRQQVNGNGATHNDSMDYIKQELDDVKAALREMRGQGITKNHFHEVLGDIWDRMDDAGGRKPPDQVAEMNKSLAKSVASFLSDDPTRAEAEKMTVWVYKSLGRRGGQRVTYNQELAGRLLLTKSISAQEHTNWKKYNRLPDDVTLNSAGRAQPQADAALRLGHMLAGMNISLLFIKNWLFTN